MTILYKIMTQIQWSNAKAHGAFTGSDVDIKDGFIHLSAAHQVKATAAKHFFNQSDLVLLFLEEEKLRAGLKWEVSRGDDLFPHYYGSLPVGSVIKVIDLPLLDGTHRFPENFPQ